MVTIRRGDVVLCDLNPVIGTEQAGIRPVVVVQVDRANAVSPHTIIVPFTTKIRRALLPSHALVPAGVGGLDRDSVALCEQIRVIDKRRIIKVLGHLDDAHLVTTQATLAKVAHNPGNGIIFGGRRLFGLEICSRTFARVPQQSPLGSYHISKK